MTRDISLVITMRIQDDTPPEHIENTIKSVVGDVYDFLGVATERLDCTPQNFGKTIGLATISVAVSRPEESASETTNLGG